MNKVDRIRICELKEGGSGYTKDSYTIARHKDYFRDASNNVPTSSGMTYNGKYRNIKFSLDVSQYLKSFVDDTYYLACQGAIIPRGRRLKKKDSSGNVIGEYNFCKLTKDTNGRHVVTLPFPMDSNNNTKNHLYSYLRNPQNGTNWITKERLIMTTDDSNPWKDRVLNRTSSSNTIEDKFGYKDKNTETYNVTFKLYPDSYISSDDDYYLAGGFVGNANAIKMDTAVENGINIHETTIKLPKNFTGKYSYTKNPDNFIVVS